MSNKHLKGKAMQMTCNACGGKLTSAHYRKRSECGKWWVVYRTCTTCGEQWSDTYTWKREKTNVTLDKIT